jgi:hypothetical protein
MVDDHKDIATLEKEIAEIQKNNDKLMFFALIILPIIGCLIFVIGSLHTSYQQSKLLQKEVEINVKLVNTINKK